MFRKRRRNRKLGRDCKINRKNLAQREQKNTRYAAGMVKVDLICVSLVSGFLQCFAPAWPAACQVIVFDQLLMPV
jgi:hypothetical protein